MNPGPVENILRIVEENVQTALRDWEKEKISAEKFQSILLDTDK